MQSLRTLLHLSLAQSFQNKYIHVYVPVTQVLDLDTLPGLYLSLAQSLQDKCECFFKTESKSFRPQVLDLAEDTLAIRSLDWDRPRFDIEFSLELGTTYNSYLIMGEKTALVDASHEKFNPLYLQTLKAELDARGRKASWNGARDK